MSETVSGKCKMALDEKAVCLWHAFTALDDGKRGAGLKSQLKVLTFNLASCVGIQKVEQNLDDYRSSSSISYQDYLHFMRVELFGRLVEDELNQNVDMDKIDEVCWLICKKQYLAREKRRLTEDDAYKLWRVFNRLAETDQNHELIYPIVIDCDEISLLVQKFNMSVGKPFDAEDFSLAAEGFYQIPFKQMLDFFETYVCNGLESEDISRAIQAIYEEILLEVLQKGYLTKKGHKITNWKERWFVLTPRALKYYTNRDEADLKGIVHITPKTTVECLADKKANKFQLITDHRRNEISAPDQRTRTEWITALKNAVRLCSVKESSKREECFKRQISRREKRRQLEEEEQQRQKEKSAMLATKEQLEREKQARAEAEAQVEQQSSLLAANLAELQLEQERLRKQTAETSAERQARGNAEIKLKEQIDLLEAEQRRLREVEELRKLEKQRLLEMEQLRAELEELLEQERQAKRDEEIVRTLQSRILEEEFSKREELEKLQELLQSNLREEKEKREQLENWKQQQEEQRKEDRVKLDQLEQERQQVEVRLAEEELRLSELESKRKDRDKELQEALKKLQGSEEARETLQTKLIEREKQKPFNILLTKLSQPGALPEFVSHRGKGAFSFGLLKRKNSETAKSPSLSDESDTQEPKSPETQSPENQLANSSGDANSVSSGD